MAEMQHRVDLLVTCDPRPNDNQMAALNDFAFNLGPATLHHSSLLTYVNEGKLAEVPDELAKWVHGGGQVLPGLVERRNAEIELWKEV